MAFASSVIELRKQKTAQSLNNVLKDDEVLLVHSGAAIQKPGGHDQTYPFLPHPDYFWLTDIRRPHGVSAYSKNSGWIDFVAPITRDEKIWEGGGNPTQGSDLGTLEQWLLVNKFRNI
ncbi:MAG: hypothetical protein K2Q18_00410, partial [Bdellovibrionales bacterium]|nr:hypothetical protein [Bdellovibrionales bacterium]